MPYPPPPPASSLARPVQGNPGAWFGADSYPAVAIRRSAQGRTVVRLAIGTDGRVTGCTLVTSSGDPDLDGATCAIPLRAGRFVPARATDGTPIASTYTMPVRWVLLRDEPGIPIGPSHSPEQSGHGWFERVMVAHHLIGLIVGLCAFLGAGIRRLVTGGGRSGSEGLNDWSYGDHLPARRRRPRWLRGRNGRIGKAVVPIALLAALFGWLGW